MPDKCQGAKLDDDSYGGSVALLVHTILTVWAHAHHFGLQVKTPEQFHWLHDGPAYRNFKPPLIHPPFKIGGIVTGNYWQPGPWFPVRSVGNRYVLSLSILYELTSSSRLPLLMYVAASSYLGT